MAVKKDELHEQIVKLTAENAELKTKLKVGNNFVFAQSAAKILTSAFKYGAAGFVAWCVYLSVFAVAGKTTDAKILFSAFADLNIISGLTNSKTSWFPLGALAVGVFGVLYGKIQSNLRKRTVKHLHQRIAEYEAEDDSNRTSSNLTATGDTNPEDK